MSMKQLPTVQAGSIQQVASVSDLPATEQDGAVRYALATDKLYIFDGSAWNEVTAGGGGTGDVVGPVSSTDNAVVRWDGTAGDTIQDSPVSISDLGNVSGVNDLDVDGTLTVGALSGVLKASAGVVSGSATTADLTEGANLYFTDERAQDAVGTILTGTATIDLTYSDATPSITADVIDGSIADAKIAVGAAINATKIGDGTVTSTEFGYLGGVTSDIQGQIDGKQATITGAATTITGSDLTASRAVIANASGKVAVSATTDTELGYVSGVTSAIQTQIDGKQPLDAELTALAGLATDGLIAKTAAGTVATRTVTAGSNKLTVTNGDGVAGNPTVDVAEANLTLDSIGGTLGVAKGGTGQTTAATAWEALSPLTTKGDILAYSTLSDRLAVGTDGQVLTADSTAASGVAWSDGGGGSGELNAIDNPSAASVTTGWTEGTSHTRTRDTSNSPLDPIVTTCLAITSSASATESSTSGIYAPIAAMPDALLSQKLKVEFYCAVPATDVWRLSVYAGTTRLSLSTDSSSVTTLPAGFTGKFTAYFDTTTATAYSVNFTNTTRTGATTLYVTNVIVGPGIQPQGYAGGPFTTVTAAIGNFSNSTGLGLSGTSVLRYRREGDGLRVQARYSFTGAGSDAGQFSWNWSALGLTGVTASTAIMDFPVAGYRNAAGEGPLALMGYFAGTSLVFYAQGQAGALTGTQINAASSAEIAELGFDIVVPITEWAGSTTNLAQNDVEYAYNTSTTASDDTTSFGYGPSGGALANFAPAGTASVTKRVQFQTPIQATDTVVLELWDGYTWFITDQRGVGRSENDAGTTVYGTVLVGISSTQVDVRFYSAASKVTSWASVYASWKYRVKKVSGGQAVGFGQATATSLGLVKGGTVPGSTAGAAIPAGYLGELGQNYTSTATNWSAGSGVYADVATRTLTAGVFLCWGSVTVLRNSVTFSALELRAGITGTAGASAGFIVGTSGGYWDAAFPTSFTYITINTPPVIVVSDGTNFIIRDGTNSGTGTTHSATQTLRFKLDIGTYASGTPQQSSMLSVVRIA